MEHQSFRNIPNDIIHIILSKLPLRSRVRFKCVCKEWCSYIETLSIKYVVRQRRLIVLSRKRRSRNKRNKTRRLSVRSIRQDLRFEEHLQPFGDFSDNLTKPGCVQRYLCSLNELVLLSVGSDLVLWNPFTRCCTKVHELPVLSNESFNVVSGLSRNSSTGEYKVVLLITHESPGYGFDRVIFSSLEKKEWWRVSSFPFNQWSVRGGIDFNNTFYWRASVRKKRHHFYYEDDEEEDENPYDNDGLTWDPWLEPNRIIYFDPASDEFRTLPTPDPRDGKEENSIVGLGNIGDCSSMARKLEEKNVIEVLVMKEYGVKESWMIAFAITTTYFNNYYFSMKFYSSPEMSTRVLFWCGFPWQMFVYDTKRNEREVFLIFGEDDDAIVCSWFCVDPPCKQQKYFRELKGR